MPLTFEHFDRERGCWVDANGEVVLDDPLLRPEGRTHCSKCLGLLEQDEEQAGVCQECDE